VEKLDKILSSRQSTIDSRQTKKLSFNSRQSTIDSRQTKKLSFNSRQSTIDKSTVDYVTNKLRIKLNDPQLGSRMVALALAKLGEGELNNISDYVLRKAHNPGAAFVTICSNSIKIRP
jgi:hypothetical protein